MAEKLKVVVVGCGNMGSSHARAYKKIEGFEVVGVVDKFPENRGKLAEEMGGVPEFEELKSALDALKPDVVSINTYPETHAELAIQALEFGAHVFVEKPLAQTVEEAQKVIDVAKEKGKKVVVGYILRHHPSWQKFIEIAQTLGKPLVMRMNLNQQSKGSEWNVHKNLLNALSPIVDCGVHYVDIMCLMTGSKPVRVHGIGARLTDEIKEDMYNYGHLHVTFEDGSVGWYEAGWGPMMSEIAFFVKDIIGPKGCVNIASASSDSANIDDHTKTNCLKVHYSELNQDGDFAKSDEIINMEDEPGHQDLCDREQSFLLKAIQEDLDLSDHLNDAVNSLRIVLAADKSFRTGKSVDLD